MNRLSILILPVTLLASTAAWSQNSQAPQPDGGHQQHEAAVASPQTPPGTMCCCDKESMRSMMMEMMQQQQQQQQQQHQGMSQSVFPTDKAGPERKH